MLLLRSLVGRILLANIAVATAGPLDDNGHGGGIQGTQLSDPATNKSATTPDFSSIPFSDTNGDTSTDESAANAILYYSFQSMVWQATLGVAMVTQNVSADALQAALVDFKRTAHASDASMSAPKIQMQAHNLSFSLLPLNSSASVKWGWAQAVTAVLPSLYLRGLPSYDRTILASVRHPSENGSDYMVRIEQADDATRLDLGHRVSGPSRALLAVPETGERDFPWILLVKGRPNRMNYHVAWTTLLPQELAATEAMNGWRQLQALMRMASDIAFHTPPLRMPYRGLRAEFGDWHLSIRVPRRTVNGNQLEFYTHMVVEAIGSIIRSQLEQLVAQAAEMAAERLATAIGQLALGFEGTIKDLRVEAAFKIEYSPGATVPDSERNTAFGDPVPRQSADEL